LNITRTFLALTVRLDLVTLVGILLMGDFATSETASQQNTQQKTNNTSKTDPWKPQANALKDIFGQAENVYNQTSQNKYTGDHLAAFRPEQLDMFGKMLGYANTSPIASQLGAQGANLSALGQGGFAAGLGGLQGFNPMDTAGTIADAGMYADNPYMSQMVDAATRDARRSTYEEGIPGVQRGAAMSGNTNSSRTGAKEAILERGYQDLRGDVSSQLRGNAYQQGITAAQNQRNQELSRLMGLTGSGLQGALGGQSGLNSSLEAMGKLFGLGNEGAAGLQASDQQGLSNELAKYAFSQDQAWAPLMNYFGIVGSQNWGGTTKSKGTSTGSTTATGTSTASPAATAGGLLTSIGSLIPGT
jgi:hypothetical protein